MVEPRQCVHTYGSWSWKAEAEGLEVQSFAWLHSKFKTQKQRSGPGAVTQISSVITQKTEAELPGPG